MVDVSAEIDWLMRGAPSVAGPDQLLQELCDRLTAHGFQFHHATVFVTTLHPNVAGRSFTWRPDVPVSVGEIPHGFFEDDAYLDKYLKQVIATGEPIRLRGGEGGVGETGRRLRQKEITDYYALPLEFTIGETHVVALATDRPGGFSDPEIAALDAIQLPLTRMAEIYASRRTAANLLSTYVGRNAGEQILRGSIKRGDSEVIHAALFFSDLRGFTRYANEFGERKLIARLNQYFDCVVPAVESHGGEVLKFMGDGMLAIFDEESRSSCSAALRAAREAQQRTDPSLEFGIALHLGEVVYGNIGASDRLDFTVIGRAVNYAARMESIAGQQGLPIILSADFIAQVDETFAKVGEFALKGIELPQMLYRSA